MRNRAIIFCLFLAMAAIGWSAPSPVHAFGDGTPDEQPPAEEIVCDDFGGRVWGLCVAYCEAQDCHVSDHPSCPVLRDKMSDLTGSQAFPCDFGPIG